MSIFNVVDLEMNQPSGAIIQIGGVRLDTQIGSIFEFFDELVNPFPDVLNPDILNLTGLVESNILIADKIEIVLKRFWEWAEHKPLISWGRDGNELVNQASILNLHLNLKKIRLIDLAGTVDLFRAGLGSEFRRGGLKNTMYSFGLTFLHRPHNALTDARNTARLAYYLIQEMKSLKQIQKILSEKKNI